jgi:hypothetical protein
MSIETAKMMECHTCRGEFPLLRKVGLRGDVSITPWGEGPPPTREAYDQYVRQATYRTAFICPGCYHKLDTIDGVGFIGIHTWNIDGKSRGDKAPTWDAAKVAAHNRRIAERDGLPEL